MFEQLDYERFTHLASKHPRIAVHQELSGDTLTPTTAFLALNAFAQDITLLESNPKDKINARYSHLCFDPIATLSAQGQTVTLQEGTQTSIQHTNPFDALRVCQSKFQAHTDHPLTGYLGGLVGFISYDAVRLIEAIPDSNAHTHTIPDLLFRCYANNLTFDHQTQKIVLATVVEVQHDDLATCYQHARDTLQNITEQLFAFERREIPRCTRDDGRNTQDDGGNTQDNADIHVSTRDEDYCAMVKQAKQHIVEGDAFQIVLSRTFQRAISSTPFDVYRALRFSNPAPYMFYLAFDDHVVVGASPEKLISIQDNLIESCPLAGTRARGEKADDILKEDLLNDTKELAEHMMLVDLARNDLGHVAVPGSVQVT